MDKRNLHGKHHGVCQQEVLVQWLWFILMI